MPVIESRNTKTQNHQNRAPDRWRLVHKYDASISISTVANNCHGKSSLVLSLFIFIRWPLTADRWRHILSNSDVDQKVHVLGGLGNSCAILHIQIRNLIRYVSLFSPSKKKRKTSSFPVSITKLLDRALWSIPFKFRHTCRSQGPCPRRTGK